MKGLRLYLQKEAWPRRSRILLAGELWGALLVACAVPVLVQSLTLKVGVLAPVLLTYSSIALGFSLAGFTVCLTLPDKAFAKKLVGTKGADGHDAYSDLLFSFSWTALVHWCLIVVSLLLLFGLDSNTAILRSGDFVGPRLLVGAVFFTAVYAFLNFLVVLVTLSQAGAVYIRHVMHDT
jgi:uncharacterized membrane protein